MSHPFLVSTSVAVVVLVSSMVSTARRPPQRGTFPPAQVVNLQVLPKNTPPAAVVDLMKQVTQALGVRCDHCHVGVDGQPLTTFDFVSDDKKAKHTARTMMRLVDQINGALDKAVPAETGGRVTCVTCHNGRRTPRK